MAIKQIIEFYVYMIILINLFVTSNGQERLYFRGPSQIVFADAVTYCQSRGAVLGSVPTLTDWNNARTACGGLRCWIGLQDDLNGNDDGIWHWVDGTDITTSYGFNADRTATVGRAPWNGGEPNEWAGTEEDCIEMIGNGRYNDHLCNQLRYPLCHPRMSPVDYLTNFIHPLFTHYLPLFSSYRESYS